MDTEELKDKKKAACLAIDKILTDFVAETSLWPTDIVIDVKEVSCLGWEGLLVYKTDFNLRSLV